MKKHLQVYFQDDFLRHNVVFFVGSLAVAVLNYIYHPLISRLLSVEEFGELQAYFSLIAQISIITSVFGKIVLNIKTNTAEQEENITNQLYSISTLLTGALGLGLIIFTPYLGAILNLSGYTGLTLTALILLIFTPLTFARSELQAKKLFGKLSISELITSFCKIIFGLLCIYLGTQALGALFGLFLAMIVGLIYTYPFSKKTIHYSSFAKPKFSPAIKTELRYGFLILIATSFITFLYTSDILIIRYFFDIETAGLYAGIATVARIIIFATGSVAGVAIAHIKINNTRNVNHIIMNKSLLLVSSIAIGGLTIFSIFPEFIIKILMGERFLPSANLLPILSLLMVLVTLTNLFIMYFLALRRYFLIPILCLSSIAIAFVIVLCHNYVQAILMNLVYSVLFVLITLIIFYNKES